MGVLGVRLRLLSCIGVWRISPILALELLRLNLRQHRLGLGQPERHVHGVVQGNGSCECGARWLWLSRLRIEATEAEVAVRQERAHAQLCGQRYGLLVGGYGW